ncbi:MAG: ABC transporter substrate-binding protein [Methanothrix sp.]|nr:MAG: ABC transporter substrate-binding protein [Methanothrix sp.]
MRWTLSLMMVLFASTVLMAISPAAADEGYPRTITDMAGRVVTIEGPIERIITTNPDNSRTIIALGDGDKIVGTDEATIGSCICPKNGSEEICPSCWDNVCGGELADIPETSTRHTVNYELTASLEPDVIFETMFWSDRADEMEEKVGAPVVCVGTDFDFETVSDQIELIGDVLDRRDEAEELIDFIDSEVEMVRSVTENLDESEKPTVYFAPRGSSKGFYDPKEGRDFTRTVTFYEPLRVAGGRNVAAECGQTDFEGSAINVGIEQIIAWDPEYIFSADDVETIVVLRSAADLESIRAVHNENVYNCFYPYCRGMPIDRSLLNMIYLAKVLHPEEFEYMDLEEEGNKIMKAFLGVDGVFTEYAEYLVWPQDSFGSE